MSHHQGSNGNAARKLALDLSDLYRAVTRGLGFLDGYTVAEQVVIGLSRAADTAEASVRSSTDVVEDPADRVRAAREAITLQFVTAVCQRIRWNVDAYSDHVAARDIDSDELLRTLMPELLDLLTVALTWVGDQ